MYLDGKKVADTKDTVFIVTHVERGEHTLEAAIIDSEGSEITRSTKVKIFMHLLLRVRKITVARFCGIA